MAAVLIDRDEQSITIQIQIPLSRSMLETEDAMQAALNEAGVLATAEALQQFDTDGSPLVFGSTRWTSKGQEPKTYQTPYGEVSVSRHVYQTSTGGTTFCPLERDARIILTSTPRFAKQVSYKYAEMSAGRVLDDLATNHGRAVARSFIQDLADAVGSVALVKEEDGHYATPALKVPIQTIGLGLDGTGVLMVQEGQRQAMVGTISLYDRDGERQHTIYVTASPEYGKAAFYQRLHRERAHVQTLYPRARLTGIADGAQDNGDFLGALTNDQVVDFYHATGYLGKVAKAACPRSFADREAWLDERCHRLKHEVGAAAALLAEMEALPTEGLSGDVQEGLQAAITYFRNHQHQMRYAARVRAKWPIGSGVTEAACKTMVKQRLCKAGAKWKAQGAGMVLSLRARSYTVGRWDQFWGKIDRYGFPVTQAA